MKKFSFMSKRVLAALLLFLGLFLPGVMETSYASPIKEYDKNLTAGSGPAGITAGPDGNLWFTEKNSNRIGRLNPVTGEIQEYVASLWGPDGITAGPDGNLWFTENDNNKIGRITPATGAIKEYGIPTTGSWPTGITAGPDGNLWFTEHNANKIGRLNPSTGEIKEYPLPKAGSGPNGITKGPDGNLWFTENEGNRIGRLNPTSGEIIEYDKLTAGCSPMDITPGPDGNLWFTEQAGNKIGRVNPVTGEIKEYDILTTRSWPAGITAGADGNIWFTETDANKLGKLNPQTGDVIEYEIPSANSRPMGLVKGPDNNIWFTENADSKIGEFPARKVKLNPQVLMAGFDPIIMDMTTTTLTIMALVREGVEPLRHVSITDNKGGIVAAMNRVGSLSNGDLFYEFFIPLDRNGALPFEFSDLFGSKDGQWLITAVDSASVKHSFPDLNYGTNNELDPVNSPTSAPLYSRKGCERRLPQVLMAGFDPAFLDWKDTSLKLQAIVRKGSADIQNVRLKNKGGFDIGMEYIETLGNGDLLYGINWTFARGVFGEKEVKLLENIWGSHDNQFVVEVTDKYGQKHQFPNLMRGDYPHTAANSADCWSDKLYDGGN